MGPQPAFFCGRDFDPPIHRPFRFKNLTDSAKTRDTLISIVEPVCEAGGYELVDIEYRREGRGWVVRVFIDRPSEGGEAEGGEATTVGNISFQDCEQVSRELSALFDVEDPVPQAYNLEVSSPGVDRPLRTAEHFARFVGERAKIAMARPLEDGNRKNFTGVIVGVDGDQAVIDVDGSEFQLPVADIRTARLVPDWDSLIAEDLKRDRQAGKNGVQA